MSINKRQRDQLFAAYWQRAIAADEAITPGQKIETADRLEREARGDSGREGYLRMPRIGGGSILLPVDHPLVAAALRGESMSMGGAMVTSEVATSPVERAQSLSVQARIGLLAAIVLLPVLFLCGFLALSGGDEAKAIAEAPTATPSPTPQPQVEPTAIEATATVLPTAEPTATPYAIALQPVGGDAAPGGNDPASLEIAGYSYVLAVGQAVNGQWVPSGAEWLGGTLLRRAIAVPWEPDVAATVSALAPGAPIRLRLRSGEIVSYLVQQVERRQRQEIEVMAGRSPSLVLILHGEPSAERWVVLASAVQEVQESFSSYTAGASSAPIAPSQPSPPTLVPTGAIEAGTVITDSQTITDSAAGLSLTVIGCSRADRIGEEEAPSRQEFVVCDVRFTASPTNSGNVPFSAEALAVTEESWMASNIDWWPPSVGVTRALRSGSLAPGTSSMGRIAGLTARAGGFGGRDSVPVIVWEQDTHRRWIIRVETSE